MKNKKIIFIHLLNDYSGSPKVLSQVIKAVQKNGSDIELYTGKSDNGFLSDLTDRHHYFFYKRFNNKYLTLISYTLSQFSLFFKLLKYRNEDVTFYINTLLPFGAALAGKVIGNPVIYHIHETSIRPQILKNFLRFIVQTCASKILFVSKSLQDLETFPRKNEYIVYNALAEDFKQNAYPYNYTWKHDGCFNVLMICSLKAYKGVYEFVTIARECESTSQIMFTLILNAEQSEIDTFFAEIELSKNITIVARQTNLFPYYQKANLVLNLSRIDEWVETFGLTIIEAMAFGIPVIVPPAGGPAEIVHDDVEGYCMSSYETSAIAKKIKELSLDQILCSKLSLNAKKRSADFSEEVFEKQLIKVLDEQK
jgi:glycosyltransferase involved in cell wall biosynthesis